MKRFTNWLAFGLLVLVATSPQAWAVTYYWDRNDNAPGANPGGPSFGDGTWDTVANNWNLNADGSGANVPWVNGSDAVFSAGSDLTGTPTYDGAVTIAAGTTATSVEIQEGIIRIASGLVNTDPAASGSPGPITVDAGAAIMSPASGQFQGGGKLTLKGTNITNAGAFLCVNTGTAGSTVNGGSTTYKTIEIDGFGRISYDDGNGTPDNQVSILSSNVITGVGGTPDNGGTGTLIKSGPDQLGMGVKDIGGVASFTLNSFAKLRVEQGGFRLRSGTVNGVLSVIDDRMFGAVPLSVLPDAITLDGGGIGSNTTVTLSANRGITIGPNGGYFDHGAGPNLIIPGPLSGSGALTIGDPTSTNTTANVAFTLSNAGNVNTFSGAIIGVRGQLTLNSSLKVAALKDSVGATPGPNTATVSIAAGQTLTVGTSSGTDTWSTVISGAGSLAKAGTGTQTLAGTPTYTGDTKVQGGTLSISNAYLADAADVYLSTGSTFNLNFVGTDTVRSLLFDNVGQVIGTWGAPGSGAAHTSSLFSGTGLLNVSSVVTPAGVPGDYNNNGVVDTADYVLWKNGGPLLNDNTPGTVDASDYTFWKAHFGNHSGSGSGLGSSSAVPEPTSVALLLLCVTGVVAGRKAR